MDRAEFRGLVADGRLEEALALADGDLLAGLDEEWADRLREEHRAEVVVLLGELAARAEAAGDDAGAIEWSRRRVAADPLGERGARDLIGRLARAGDRAGAIGAFEALRDRLRRELGIVPSAETRELVEQVRRGRPAADRAPDAPSTQPPLPAPLTGAGRFVGRDDALARLSAAWDDARGGALRIACLAGEPGIGKTRLAAELAGRVHASGALVLYGRSDEETLVPHQPFVEALERLLRDCRRRSARTSSAPAAATSHDCCPHWSPPTRRRPRRARPRATAPSRRPGRSWRRPRPAAPPCWCSTTCTGPTRPRCCCCVTWAAWWSERRCWCSSRTATRRSTAPTRSRPRWGTCGAGTRSWRSGSRG